jgi:hypothetical protein
MAIERHVQHERALALLINLWAIGRGRPPRGDQYTQVCVEGMADGDNSTSERLIYGADEAGCNNETTGCDTEYAHWSWIGSLWVR